LFKKINYIYLITRTYSNLIMESHNFHQQIKKKYNQDKILELIKSEGKTNKQLLDGLTYSHTILGKHLKELLKRREIKKDVLNGEIVYVLGDKGIIHPDDISHLSNHLEKIKKRDGEAHYDYSRLWMESMVDSLPWGIISHLVMDKDLKEQNLFSRNDMREIEELVYKKIISNLKNNKIKKQGEQGDLVIGFSVNFAEMLKSSDSNSP